MIRTVTALFDDTGDAEAAFDTLSRRLVIQKGAIVTAGPGEKPDFGTMYLSRHQREACEAELEGGGSLLIVQVEGDAAAEQAADQLDRLAAGESAAPAPAALAREPAPAPSPAPPQAAPRLAKGGSVAGVPISTLSRRAAPPAPPAPSAPSAPEIATAPAAPEPEPVSKAPPTPEPVEPAEASIPLVEEELRVGKRAVMRGGARVHAFVEEVPVVESIELLEERTEIERRPVNRRLSEEEIAASGLLQDRVVEIAEMREEAVVTKEAFVREELVVKKTVEKRVEQIHDTVRRTAVEMERLEPELTGEGPGGRG